MVDLISVETESTGEGFPIRVAAAPGGCGAGSGARPFDVVTGGVGVAGRVHGGNPRSPDSV